MDTCSPSCDGENRTSGSGGRTRRGLDRLGFVAARKAAARRPELREQIALARSGPARELPAVVRCVTHAISARAQMRAKPPAERLACALGAAGRTRLVIAGKSLPYGNREIIFDNEGKEAAAGTLVGSFRRPSWLKGV